MAHFSHEVGTGLVLPVMHEIQRTRAERPHLILCIMYQYHIVTQKKADVLPHYEYKTVIKDVNFILLYNDTEHQYHISLACFEFMWPHKTVFTTIYHEVCLLGGQICG